MQRLTRNTPLKFELVDPHREWKVKAAWFMVQDKLDVRIRSR